MQLRPKYSVLMNKTFHNVFVNISKVSVSVMNVRCPLSLNLSVQNVHLPDPSLLRNDRIEI